jgi:4-diphosphocytidyl-2-C-methyl-D-erythritol kinase
MRESGRMRAESYAKINWTLRILGRRADGYHDLETVFQAISLHDTLTFKRAESLALTCDDPSIPVDGSNLIVRAAQALGVDGVRIHVEKRIPAGGGLGGGSSNAATTLQVLDEMFELATPPDRMREIALSLGSDVPFFLVGGTAYATGRGEIITPLPSARPVHLLLVLPEVRVSTAEAFRLIQHFSTAAGPDVLSRPEVLTNDFEGPIFAKHPQLQMYKSRLLASGAFWASMTGSGSTIVGAYRRASERDAAMAIFTDARVAAAQTV